MRWHHLSAPQLFAQDLPQRVLLLQAGQLHGNGTINSSAFGLALAVHARRPTQHNFETMHSCQDMVHAADSNSA